MKYEQLEKAIQVIQALRDPKTGCPWDLEQDHSSLIKYLIEESYEYIQAVENQDDKHMEEELGDVLLQVLLHSQIASERGAFSIESVAKKLSEKMIFRHPHVFKDPNLALNSDEVVKNWKKSKPKKKYHINTSDAYAPALEAARNIGAKSQAVNFDWDHFRDVLAKVDEELLEVKEELEKNQSSQALYEEVGDLLFSVAQLARHLDINPEQALKDANLKFIKRINKVEDIVKERSQSMQELTTNELEEVWAIVKKELKGSLQN